MRYVPQRRATASLFFLFALISSPASPLHAEEIDVARLVDQVIAAYGGKAALTASRSFRQTGETFSFGRDGRKGRIIRTFDAPDRLRVEINYPGEAPEVRILDGDQGWNQGHQAPPPLVDAMRLQAARLDLPLLLLEAGERVKDLGYAPAEDGRIVRTLGLALADHLALFVDVEVPGYRILRSRGQMRGGGSVVEFSAVYQDFRRWSGVLIPGREEQYAMGQHIGYTIVEAVEPLSAPDAAAFRP